MKVCHVVIVAVLTSAHLGMGAPDWVNDLTENINAMTRNIQDQVNSLTRNLHSQIENSLRPALAEANRAIENLPRDAQGRIISSGGNIISINSVNGISRMIMSGHTSDGEPYVRDVEERNDGQYLYHNETSYNPRTRTTETIRWKLDLRTPGAKPEFFTNEK